MAQQSQTQNESREQHYQQLNKLERRLTCRNILLPFFVLVMIVVAIFGIMLSLQTPTQVAVVSDFMWIIFILCPLVICTFPLVVLMLVLVGLMNKLHVGAKSPLRRLEQWTYTAEKKVESWSAMVDSRVLDMAVKFAPIRRILTIFDTPSSEGQDEGGTHESRTTDH